MESMIVGFCFTTGLILTTFGLGALFSWPVAYVYLGIWFLIVSFAAAQVASENRDK
jgi:hypothetical protein